MMKRIGSAAAILALAGSLAACATNPDDIAPSYVSPTLYLNLTCDQLREEAMRVSSRAAQAVGAQEERAQNDAVAMGVGMILFWPALFFLQGDGTTESEVARLRGEMQAIELASTQKNCGIVFQAAPA